MRRLAVTCLELLGYVALFALSMLVARIFVWVAIKAGLRAPLGPILAYLAAVGALFAILPLYNRRVHPLMRRLAGR